jgi:hypothetical protein
MSSGPQDKNRPKPNLPGDRATAPVPLEDSSDAAWHEFVLLQSGHSSVGDTQPLDLPSGGAPRRASHEPVSVVNTMLLARTANRTCPIPSRWAELYALLPLRDGKAAPEPIRDKGMVRVSPIQKRLRLRDHIEWASAGGALPAVHSFLSALPETDWEHFG